MIVINKPLAMVYGLWHKGLSKTKERLNLIETYRIEGFYREGGKTKSITFSCGLDKEEVANQVFSLINNDEFQLKRIEIVKE